MKVQTEVHQTWQALSSRERRVLRAFAKGSPDAGLRCRCKIILSLVQGNSPSMIVRGGQCSESQVYRAARRFIDQGPSGLADRREDNGEAKVSEEYEAELFEVVARSPRNYGYRRPTWTQELLVLVLAKRTGVRISCTTMSRLLRRLRIRLGRPKPIVGCPWKKARKTRRLRVLTRLIKTLPKDEVYRLCGRGGHSPEPQDRPGLDASRDAENRVDARQERETLLGWGLTPARAG